MSPFFMRRWALLSLLLICPAYARAQELLPVPGDNTPAPGATGTPDPSGDTGDDNLTNIPSAPLATPAPTALDVATQTALDRANILLDARNPAAVDVARAAAQNALRTLDVATGGNALDATMLPADSLSVRLALGAIQAHALWGRAAQGFGRRDEAITALVRAKTLLVALPTPPDPMLVRDVNLQLNTLLRAGLPLSAPDDVLSGIAARVHGNLWRARRFDFAPLSGQGAKEMLVTQGQLFPPAARDGNLVRLPSLYSDVAADRLPPSLQLNRMVAGYERASAKGNWRQTVRVFYASPFLTRNKRDDSVRAADIASQFLRVHALYQDQLGASNLYARGPLDDGVTTLYLLEISALWPQDDDDPVVLANLGPKMPPINIGPRSNNVLRPRGTPTMRPWMAIAGTSESDPGEILFWKAGSARSESEWLRELFHEYGHVSLPPFGGFRAPLEPYANGLIGETLGALWGGQNMSFSGPSEAPIPANDFLFQVNHQALPARQIFLRADPRASHLGGTFADLRFLQGLCVVCERAYGAPLLGRAFAPLSQRAASVSDVAERRSLLTTDDLQDALVPAMRQMFAARRSLPIYLPAALDVPLDARALINRAPVHLSTGTRANGWIYVPSGATSLRIEASGLSVLGFPWSRDNDATKVYFGGKTGWQRLSLVARTDTVLSGARFE